MDIRRKSLCWSIVIVLRYVIVASSPIWPVCRCSTQFVSMVTEINVESSIQDRGALTLEVAGQYRSPPFFLLSDLHVAMKRRQENGSIAAIALGFGLVLVVVSEEGQGSGLSAPGAAARPGKPEPERSYWIPGSWRTPLKLHRHKAFDLSFLPLRSILGINPHAPTALPEAFRRSQSSFIYTVRGPVASQSMIFEITAKRRLRVGCM